jgi:hypothetical protein
MAQEIGVPNGVVPEPEASLAAVARLEKRLARERAARAAAESAAERAVRNLHEKQEALRRYIAFIELLQDITVAANQAKTIDDAYAYALRQICTRDRWPVGHVYVIAPDDSGELTPTGIWHLAEPERFESWGEGPRPADLGRIGRRGRARGVRRRGARV